MTAVGIVTLVSRDLPVSGRGWLVGRGILSKGLRLHPLSRGLVNGAAERPLCRQ